MHLDIRFPIGALFFSIGALLVAYGLWAAPTAAGSPYLNVNALWGAVMAAFGLAMLVLARRAASRIKLKKIAGSAQ